MTLGMIIFVVVVLCWLAVGVLGLLETTHYPINHVWMWIFMLSSPLLPVVAILCGLA